MKAIIIGGGIGGLATAIALRRVGVEAVVFERAGDLREIGAGISIWTNAVKALEKVGLSDVVRGDGQDGGQQEIGGAIRTASGRKLGALPVGALERQFGPSVVTTLSIGWPVGSFVGGRMLLRTGYRATLLLGATLIAAGAALCVPMSAGTSLVYVVFAVVVIGLGLGFTSTSYLVAVQNAVPWRRRGIATSSVVFFRTIGGSVGVAIMGALLNYSLGDRYQAAVERASGGDSSLVRLLSDPNALMQPAVRSRILEDAYAELAGVLAAALSPAFLVLLVFGISTVAVAAFFPRVGDKDVSREEEHA